MPDLKSDGTQAVMADHSVGSLTKYQDLVVGDRAWGHLVRYELITSLFANWPGAMGFWLRRRFYPRLFRKCGRKPVFGRNLSLRCPNRITLGDDVDNFSVFDVSSKLREYGWLVPAYTFPKNREDLAVLRIVCRNGFSRDLADMFLGDLTHSTEYLQALSGPLPTVHVAPGFRH